MQTNVRAKWINDCKMKYNIYNKMGKIVRREREKDKKRKTKEEEEEKKKERKGKKIFFLTISQNRSLISTPFLYFPRVP